MNVTVLAATAINKITMDKFDLKKYLAEGRLNESETILGWRWKSPQMRRDNVEEALDIMGLGKNQDRLYNSLPREGKMVAIVDSSDPDSACEKLRKAGKLEEWFEPVYK